MASKSAIEARLSEACASLEIPGVVAIANTKDGFDFAEAFGINSLKEGRARQPLELNSTFYLASATKLITAIAALQCVERGQFTLDEDATRLLPEFKDLNVLTGFDDTGKPVLVKATKTITLRHLLTHTSGLAYEAFNPLLQQWRQSTGNQLPLTKLPVAQRFLVPLLFEPGSSFIYSTGYDFAGVMVARANSTTLTTYMEKNIFQPLGIENITFNLQFKPQMLPRHVDMSMRTGDVNAQFGTAIDSSAPLVFTPPFDLAKSLEDESGGAGAFASLVDYSKILKSLSADDEKLLGPDTVEELFRPQLGGGPLEKFQELLTFKEMNNIMAGIGVGVNANHSFGGAVIMEDIPGRRRMGTMTWAGMPNLYWWIDRAAGISGVFGTQILPTGDEKAIELFREFENFVYAVVKWLSKGVRD